MQPKARFLHVKLSIVFVLHIYFLFSAHNEEDRWTGRARRPTSLSTLVLYFNIRFHKFCGARAREIRVLPAMPLQYQKLEMETPKR